MDRFALQFSLGFVSPSEELKILASQLQDYPIEHIQPCLSLEEIFMIKALVRQVRIT